MRIALLAHSRYPIREPFMGGMEAHVYHLAHALRDRGHEVTLYGAGDSEVGVPVYPIVDHHYELDYPMREYHGTDALNDHVDAAFARAGQRLLERDFDIVHNNSLHRYPPRLARAQRIPMVTSLHVPSFDWLRRAVHEGVAPWSRFTATSHTHAKSYWKGEWPPEAHIVPNGIDLARWPFHERGDGSILWAGRIAPNKGPHLAVHAAAMAGLTLDLYGPVEERTFFDAEIRPFLSDRIRYRGHASADELAAAMGRAGAFAFTPLWDEPFGLVAVEAMASGLPVAAFDNGAVREVIGAQAGRIVPGADVPALAGAMEAALRIPRRNARAWVEDHFTIDRMVDGYERVYAAAIAGLSKRRPAVVFPAVELAVARQP